MVRRMMVVVVWLPASRIQVGFSIQNVKLVTFTNLRRASQSVAVSNVAKRVKVG